MRKFIIPLLVASLSPIGFWFAGFDFDHRGEVALWCFYLTIVSFVLSCWLRRIYF